MNGCLSVSCPVGMDKNVFAGIMSTDMSDVRGHIKDKEGLAESYLILLEIEWKKYLCMIYLNKGKKFPMSAPVDHFAHAHISHTRSYHDFCSNVMGGYVHHTPTKNEEERNALLPSYLLSTIPIMEKLFGVVDESIWDRKVCVCTYDIDDGDDD